MKKFLKRLIIFVMVFIMILSSVLTVNAQSNKSTYSIAINGILYHITEEYDINNSKIVTVEGNGEKVIGTSESITIENKYNNTSETIPLSSLQLVDEKSAELQPMAAASCNSVNGYSYYSESNYRRLTTPSGTKSKNVTYGTQSYAVAEQFVSAVNTMSSNMIGAGVAGLAAEVAAGTTLIITIPTTTPIVIAELILILGMSAATAATASPFVVAYLNAKGDANYAYSIF